jgi:hypothetical protein
MLAKSQCWIPHPPLPGLDGHACILNLGFAGVGREYLGDSKPADVHRTLEQENEPVVSVLTAMGHNVAVVGRQRIVASLALQPIA